MRSLLIPALLVFSAPSFGTVATARFGAWQWQREITPAASGPADEQCVVLDADLYAGAAPGLRDVLLIQDGREIPYALEESYDDSAPLGNVAASGRVDRSLYTTVLQIPLKDITSPALDKSRVLSRHMLEQGSAMLLRRVPVEQIELVPDVTSGITRDVDGGERTLSAHLLLLATSDTDNASPSAQQQPDATEKIESYLDVDHPVERTAIGANLQRHALVTITVQPGSRHFAGVRLQMHRRSLCYQPLTAAPLLLLYGNANARPPHYDYASHYQPIASPLLAHMGPAKLYPGYRPPMTQVFSVTRLQRLSLAVCVAAAGFLLTAVTLLRSR